MVAAEHDLGVVDDVQREDDGANRGVTNLGVPEMLKCHSLLTLKWFMLPRRGDKGEEYSCYAEDHQNTK